MKAIRKTASAGVGVGVLVLESTCLACARPWVPSLLWKRKGCKGREGGKEEERQEDRKASRQSVKVHEIKPGCGPVDLR